MGFEYGFLALSKRVLCSLKLSTLNEPSVVAALGSLGNLGFGSEPEASAPRDNHIEGREQWVEP